MSANLSPRPEPDSVSGLTDHLFRHEAGKLVSILTGIFGVHRLQLAEDVVQEAMARALKTWPYYGIPENPAAWLMLTARHLALDTLRREKRFAEKQADILVHLDRHLPEPKATTAQFEGEIADQRLQLMFACCHPILPWEMQVALALKVLGGFSPREIAAAFLTSEAAIAKRLTRARQRLQRDDIAFVIPAGPDLRERLDGVLRTLYLLFNEGYKASRGENLVREELCAEAIRLASLLTSHPEVAEPRVHALLALMLFNAARLSARLDASGSLLRLEDQDRSRWNRAMIQRGLFHLAQSTGGDEASTYHLQAGIAASHCLARDHASTDWTRILSLYDHLREIDHSPLIALNRVVAFARVHGPEAGMAELEALLGDSALSSYYLTHAILGDFERERDRPSHAATHYEDALHLTEVESERTFLERRVRECRGA